MKKYAGLMLLVGLLFLGFTGAASAEIIVDFDNPALYQEDPDGNYDYLYSTPYGDIGIIGNISNVFAGNAIADVTRSGNFLSEDGNSLSLDFSFLNYSVRSFDFHWLTAPDVTLYGIAYDDQGNAYDSDPFYGDGAWQYDRYDFQDGVTVFAIELGADNGYWTTDETTGNEYFVGAALDDMRLFSDPVTTAIPEPASMALFGFGLVGLARMRRRAC